MGSEVVIGVVVKEGRVGTQRYRIVETDQPDARVRQSGFVNGLIGVPGASVFAPAVPNSGGTAASWGRDLVVLGEPVDEHPMSATLSLDASKPKTALFLREIPRQELRFACLVGQLAHQSGTLTVTSGDPNPRTVQRATVVDGMPNLCDINCRTIEELRAAQAAATSSTKP